MTITIAVAGKGGTGKTTVSALIVDHLARLGVGNILAVDADPSTNLNLALGVDLGETIGSEDVRDALREDRYVVTVPDEIAARARGAIDRMVALG